MAVGRQAVRAEEAKVAVEEPNNSFKRQTALLLDILSLCAATAA